MSLSKISVWCLSGLSLIVGPAALRAELDKEEKERKDVESAKSGLGDDEHEELHDRLIEEGEKTLQEINKLLEEIQNNLGGQQTGEATQSKQRQVVERLEKLIKSLDKGCSSCSASSSQAKQQKQQKQQQASGQKDQGGKKQPKDQKGEQRQNQKQKVADEKQTQQQKQEKKPGEGAEKDGKVENDRKEDGPPPDSKSGKLADSLNEARRWGVLPAKFAEAILFSAGKEAPAEYREVISRYYKKLTEIQARGR